MHIDELAATVVTKCVKTEDTIGDDGGRKRVTRKSEGYKVGIPGVVVKGVLS